MKLHQNQVKLLKYLKKVDSLEDLSLWQIARDTGLNNAQTVSHHLKQLEKYGYLRRSLHNPNQFEILKDPIEDVIYVNQYGFAQCGHESEFMSDDNLIESIPLPTKLFGLTDPKTAFLVQAKGESMQPYIKENDLVLFKRQDDISGSGDVALVLDDGMPKIKRLAKKEGKGYTMMSINPKFESKDVKKGSDFRIVGVARGVIHGL